MKYAGRSLATALAVLTTTSHCVSAASLLSPYSTTTFNVPEPFCGPTNTPKLSAELPPQSAGTKRMVQLLQMIRLDLEAHPERTIFFNDKLAVYYHNLLEQATNDHDILQLESQVAVQLLQAGQNEQ